MADVGKLDRHPTISKHIKQNGAHISRHTGYVNLWLCISWRDNSNFSFQNIFLNLRSSIVIYNTVTNSSRDTLRWTTTLIRFWIEHSVYQTYIFQFQCTVVIPSESIHFRGHHNITAQGRKGCIRDIKRIRCLGACLQAVTITHRRP